MSKFSRSSLFHIIRANTCDMLIACANSNPARKWQGILMLLLFTEYGLKYKLQQSGINFPKTHDLLELYRLLPCNDKDTIKKRYDEISQSKRFNVRISIESLLETHKNAYIEWRYDVFSENDVPQNSVFEIRAIQILFCIVIDTTDINPVGEPLTNSLEDKIIVK